MLALDDTIAAVASPPGGAARGIVRVSGPKAVECVAAILTAGGADIPVCLEQCSDDGQTCLLDNANRRVIAGELRLADLHSPLPCELYLWCGDTRERGGENGTPALRVRSYTGQPVVEIHTIGSPPLLQMVLRALCGGGARLAGPGEFTLRAFLAGRIDLTQAEAVLGVIDAESPAALDAALVQLAGGLARPLHRLRDELIELLVHLEASFDFADEDLPFITRDELDRRLAVAENELAAIERQMTARTEHVDVVQAVLIGRPNTGKSSLFNALAGRGAALVSHQPGTTRDYLTAELDFDGVKCHLIDTAGIADAPPAVPCSGVLVEQAVQSAAWIQRRNADVRLLCLDATRPIDAWEHRQLAEVLSAQRAIVVLTKCDAPRGLDTAFAAVETSSLTGQGIERLREELRRKICAGGHRGTAVASTAARCRESLRLAGECLGRARNVAVDGQEELAAAEIRTALDELGKTVGAVYTDDVLDRIFSRFCIGK